jgi:hypothetical protein
MPRVRYWAVVAPKTKAGQQKNMRSAKLTMANVGAQVQVSIAN